MANETTAKQPTVKEVMNNLLVEIKTLMSQRDTEIARLNALAPVATKREAPKYTRGTASDEFWAMVTQGMINQTGLDNAVKDGKIVKVTVAKAPDATYAGYNEVTKSLSGKFDALKKTAMSNVPTKKIRSPGTGSAGSHAITKEWFDKHSKECPAPMEVQWDDTAKKITYNLPKGGRGGTVSHGALNNVVKAWKDAPAAKTPAAPATPAPAPKTVPAKKAAKPKTA
jgi:hypothetical protein